MQVDGDSSRLSVRMVEFLDNVTRLFLWVFATLVIFVVWVFSKESGVLFFFSILILLSFFAHLLGELAEVWRTYPLWLEIAHQVNAHRRISFPLWISAATLSLALCRQERGWIAALVSFILFVIVERFIAFRVQKSEEIFRLIFRSFTDDEHIHSDVEVCETKSYGSDLVTFPATSEDNLLLLRTERYRNRTTETIQGEALVEFDENSDSIFLNLPFCPPFDGIPQFDFEQISGTLISVNISLLQGFGVRLEVKKTTSVTGKEPVRLSFYAVFPPLDR